MSTSPHQGADARPSESLIPLFVCPGCRPAPLGYAMFELGDGLDEMVPCPARELCAWYAGHDLGGRTQYTDHPAAGLLEPAFRQTPYFSCPNFHRAG